jgi:hypothetical protein
MALGLTLNADDVYVTGYQDNGIKNVAKVWKNGTPLDLTDGSADAQASDVALCGSDVIVAGYEYKGANKVAMQWVLPGYGAPGSPMDPRAVLVQPMPLTDGSQNASANAIAVAGADVYLAGYVPTPLGRVATLWKNGLVLESLTDGNNLASAVSMTLAGDAVFASGHEYANGVQVAKYWKNLEATALTDGRYAASGIHLEVWGDVVYVAGTENNGTVNVAKVWKNGQAFALTDGTANAKALSVRLQTHP